MRWRSPAVSRRARKHDSPEHGRADLAHPRDADRQLDEGRMQGDLEEGRFQVILRGCRHQHRHIDHRGNHGLGNGLQVYRCDTQRRVRGALLAYHRPEGHRVSCWQARRQLEQGNQLDEEVRRHEEVFRDNPRHDQQKEVPPAIWVHPEKGDAARARLACNGDYQKLAEKDDTSASVHPMASLLSLVTLSLIRGYDLECVGVSTVFLHAPYSGATNGVWSTRSDSMDVDKGYAWLAVRFLSIAGSRSVGHRVVDWPEAEVRAERLSLPTGEVDILAHADGIVLCRPKQNTWRVQ